MDLTAASKNRFMELNELMELRDGAYENTQIYKERNKRWHDSRLRGDNNFKMGDKVLLFNSRFKMHLGKLKSRWYGPNVVKIVYPYGTMEIINRNGISFKVNGQRLKKYHDGHIDAECSGIQRRYNVKEAGGKNINTAYPLHTIWHIECLDVISPLFLCTFKTLLSDLAIRRIHVHDTAYSTDWPVFRYFLQDLAEKKSTMLVKYLQSGNLEVLES
ncbi:hypothetical protein Tco_1062302 [Tanacetum coccineum]